jgi:hypothetical protein
MIPHRLNLLSPTKRQYLKKMVTFQFLKTALEITLIFLCFTGVTLLTGQLIIQDYLNRLTENVTATGERYNTLNQDIKKINNILIKTEKVQNEFKDYAGPLQILVQSIPENISLSILRFNSREGTCELTGQTKKREDLLLLKNALEKTNLVENINIPPAQLTEKTNVTFSLLLKLKKN